MKEALALDFSRVGKGSTPWKQAWARAAPQTQVGRPLIDVTYLCLDFVGERSSHPIRRRRRKFIRVSIALPKLIMLPLPNLGRDGPHQGRGWSFRNSSKTLLQFS